MTFRTNVDSHQKKQRFIVTIFNSSRSNLSTGVGWIRGSFSRCRVPKEVYGHGKGRVKSIPNAYWGIGKRVPQIVRKTSGKSI